MSSEEAPQILKGWADDDEELKIDDLVLESESPQVKPDLAHKKPLALDVNSSRYSESQMYDINMAKFKREQAMREQAKSNRKPSLCGMIVVIIVRNLMCFFMVICVLATIYMMFTLEENTKSTDFNLELTDNYQKAQEYVNKNKNYYMPGPVGAFQEAAAQKANSTEGVKEGTFLDLVNKATENMKQNFNQFQKEIAPGFVMINPLYVELQKKSPISKPDYEIASVDLNKNMSLKQFYRSHLSKSLPLIFKNGCMKWQLTKDLFQQSNSLKKDDYMKELVSGVEIHKLTKPLFRQHGINVLGQGYGQETVSMNNFYTYAYDKHYSKSKSIQYLQDQDVTSERIITKIGEKSRFPLDHIEKYESVLLTQWDDFIRLPQFSNKEKVVCVVDGREKFKIVSPIYRQNIYVGVFDFVPPHQSPLNFFDVDYVKWRMAKNVKFIDFTLAAGDCVYIPAFFYVQTQSKYGESTLITHAYKAHSQFVDMFMDGIENKGLVDEKENSYDTQLMKFMSQFY